MHLTKLIGVVRLYDPIKVNDMIIDKNHTYWTILPFNDILNKGVNEIRFSSLFGTNSWALCSHTADNFNSSNSTHRLLTCCRWCVCCKVNYRKGNNYCYLVQSNKNEYPKNGQQGGGWYVFKGVQ